MEYNKKGVWTSFPMNYLDVSTSKQTIIEDSCDPDIGKLQDSIE